MPRIPCRAPSVQVRAKTLLTALFAAVAVTLSACESTGTSSLGSWFGGDEAGNGETPATTDKEPQGGAAETPSGESGEVVDIISAEATPATQPTDPAPDAAEPPGESLAAIPPEPAINDDPEQLIGMGPASLNAFLGAPELIRREAPASLWQYRAEDCVLDVVLYPDRTGDKVTYLEARENGATKIPPRACLNKLLRARFDGSSG